MLTAPSANNLESALSVFGGKKRRVVLPSTAITSQPVLFTSEDIKD